MTTFSTWLVFSLALACCSLAAEDVPYGVAKSRWPAGLGNHRARLIVAEKAEAVRAHIPWRRHDPAPEKKNVLVVDAAGKTVANRVVVEVNREFGDMVFQADAAGEYFLYYMPFSEKTVNWQYSTEYATPQSTAEPGWLDRNGLTPDRLRDGKWRTLPEAKVVEFQTWHDFHRFDPMEVIATAQETKDLIAKYPESSYLLFPEDRKFPIRMTDDLPLRWVRNGPSAEFKGEAQRGEFYVFQVGLYAARKPIEDMEEVLSDGLALPHGQRGPGTWPPRAFFPSDLRKGAPHEYPDSTRLFHAFNLSGIDWLGRPMEKTVAVPQGKVQALWFGLRIPKNAAPGDYEGRLWFEPKGAEETNVHLSIKVTPQVLEDGGVSELWRQARLEWLDSTIGLGDDVVAPYTPLEVDGKTVKCLGRQVTFGPNGLPQSIRSGQREILGRPIALVAETANGPIAWTGDAATVNRIAEGAATAQAENAGGPFKMSCEARMEFDGYINFRVTLKAEQAADLKDIRLEIPYRRDVATYMMGFCRPGGTRPREWKWAWNVNQATNMVWLGDFDAGLQVKLKGPKDTWDIADLRAGGIPPSWGNQGKGGATVSEEGDAVIVRAFSGPRSLKAGEEVEFRFGLLITPVKPLDPAHWTQRYYHYYAPVVPVETVAATGANIINCHQGNALNPYINYPFLTTEAFGAYVRQAHARGIRVKTYYTVRELSNYVAELWALRSLGFEVFLDGGGGGHSWLREHLASHYASAWHQPYPNGEVDAAIATTGLSRWHNYYLEGLGWLVRNVGLDGLYLDGIGYDREIMKRVRRVMDRARPGCLIDFHSGNEYPGMRISAANKYMEHFPYINSLWFGEGYDYNESPDYWLVEISGIPFGLYGEMLEGGGNPWRGMVYGMTCRLGWGGDPRRIWRVWDDFGIQESRTIGYWDPACPVKTGRKDVLATAYVKRGKTLVSLASWAKEPAQVRLGIDWKALGLDPQKAKLFAPAIQSFQPAALFEPTDEIPVAPARGWLLYLDEEKHEVPVAKVVDVHKDRVLLLEDRFARADLGDPWKISLSTRPKTALRLAKGAVAIESAANSFAMAERPLPPGVTLAECAVFSGTDKGASWGPGLSLVWKNRPFRINLRAEGRFGVDDGSGQWFGSFVAPNYWYYLRIRLEKDEVLAESSPDGKLWETIHALPRGHFAGDPFAVRIGRMSPGSRGEDFHDPGVPESSCLIKDLWVYGAKR